jgi:hypothetical protein
MRRKPKAGVSCTLCRLVREPEASVRGRRRGRANDKGLASVLMGITNRAYSVKSAGPDHKPRRGSVKTVPQDRLAGFAFGPVSRVRLSSFASLSR